MIDIPNSRPLLPHRTAMQNFAFAPPNLGLGDNKKSMLSVTSSVCIRCRYMLIYYLDYVFVDEHNRHKRLKGICPLASASTFRVLTNSTVMRACEGCRRRKIKCDAATTNTWPCAACVRLKLHCVPPTVNYDRTHTGSGQISGLERVLDFDNSSGSGEDDYGQHMSGPQVFELGNPTGQMHVPQTPYNDALGVFHTPPYSDRALSQHEFSTYEEIPPMPAPFPDHNAYQTPTGSSMPSGSGVAIWRDEQQPVGELSDVMGELKIDENGIGT